MARGARILIASDIALGDVLRICVAGVLAAAAAAKLVGGRESWAGLRSFGLTRERTQRAVWLGLIAVEAGLAAALFAGPASVAVAAAALLAAFAAAQGVQLVRGRRGSPCGCFGRRSRIGIAGVARDTVLAAAAASVPATASVRFGTEAWLAAGLVFALGGFALLALAVLALAREVGELRLRLVPQAALSLPDEGPALDERVDAVDHLETPFELGLAVFSSRTCALCTALEPAVRLVSTEPSVAVRVFDEEDDADVWTALRIPGSPYAIVLDPGGRVLAKATFNSLAQLEALLADGARRRRRVEHARV